MLSFHNEFTLVRGVVAIEVRDWLSKCSWLLRCQFQQKPPPTAAFLSTTYFPMDIATFVSKQLESHPTTAPCGQRVNFAYICSSGERAPISRILTVNDRLTRNTYPGTKYSKFLEKSRMSCLLSPSVIWVRHDRNRSVLIGSPFAVWIDTGHWLLNITTPQPCPG